MKIKCYDKYNKQWLTFTFTSDELWDLDSFSSHYCWGKVGIKFEALDGEDPNPKRWSDLEKFEIVKN